MPKSTLRHITFADAYAGWETISIPPDYECVPNARVVVGSPDTGRKTLSILPNHAHVPGSVVFAGATDSGWEPM